MNDATKPNGQASSRPEGKGQSPAELINDFLDWLSPARIGALYALSIVISALFDTIYLQALGISITAAPMSIADHIRSSVIWVPPVLIAVTATLIVSALWSQFHEGLLNGVCKMTISLVLLLVMIVLTHLAMWWWTWDVLAPYDFSSSKDVSGALDALKSVMIQLPFWIWGIFIIIFCLFPIYQSMKPEKDMKLRRIESMVLVGFSSALFTSFLALIISISIHLSALGSCVEALSPKFSINNKEFVIFRSFEKHFLVSSCKEGRIEFKFLSTDEVDSTETHKQNAQDQSGNEQDQNATKQTEESGADPNPTNPSTQPAASQPPPPNAEQR